MISPELDLKPIHDAHQAGLAEDEICIREGIVLKIAPESRFPFEFFCWRSPPMVKEMDCFIKHGRGRKTLLDVGAFHGLFSLVFGGESLAFEPSENFETLQVNLALGNPDSKLMKLSLSDHEGDLDMHGECGHWVTDESRQHRNVDDPHQSKCHTGDWVCASSFHNANFLPDTIKIDVEGHEVKVLRGLQETIKRMLPIIFIEVHLDKLAGQGESIADVVKLLPNYRFLYTGTEEEIDPLNLPPIEERDPHFVCLPCP